MSDFFEIDFLNVEAKESGDAIPLRYSVGGIPLIHLTDGGFQGTGDKIIKHIQRHYNNSDIIDAIIVSHADGDHTGGLADVLKQLHVRALWMLRPWCYAGELLNNFPRWSNPGSLARQLKKNFSNIAELEAIAHAKGIPIYEPFQGARIGEFIVLAPSRDRYLNLVVESDKTPKGTVDKREFFLKGRLASAKQRVSYTKLDWGKEVFTPEETSPDNEMSVVQYADLCGNTILLAGDAGRGTLTEAAIYAYRIGIQLGGLDWFQVPHHGSRRNLSPEILNWWLGGIVIPDPAQHGIKRSNAIISASKEDDAHPRKATIRYCIHRGSRVFSTEYGDIRAASHNAPAREGWGPASNLLYPKIQETN